MRQYKTSKKNRATYTYYSADGKKLMELVHGENGVTEADIAMLHEQDDLEYNAQRREDYHAPVHYDSYTVSDGQAPKAVLPIARGRWLLLAKAVIFFSSS